MDGEARASLPSFEPSLIVRSRSATRVRSAPVYVNSCNLTKEISVDEDARLSQAIVVDEDHVDGIFRTLLSAAPESAVTDEDRARVVLCRLLLGPVAVPCYCDDWDVDEYMTRCAYQCRGPVLYVHRGRCRCGVDYRPLMFTVMHDHYSTHVFRGLLSLAEWNTQLSSVFCRCTVFRSDRYVMAVLPKQQSIYIDYYPYFLGHLARFLTVPEMDDCVNAMTVHLGPQIAARVNVHYKMLFGATARPRSASTASRANYDLFLLELQKLRLNVNYHNDVTRDFFECVFSAFHRDTGNVMLALRSPGKVPLTLKDFSLSTFKQQVLYFDLTVKYQKNKRDLGRNGLVFQKTVMTFREDDVLWRNLFFVYYVWSPRAAGVVDETRCERPVAATDRDRREGSEHVPARRYVRIVERLTLVRFRQRERNRDVRGKRCFDFRPAGIVARYRAVAASRDVAGEGEYGTHLRSVVGGREFSEMTAVSFNRLAVNAFNTNRVINLKATLSETTRSRLTRVPKNMTHSFVMYKHTFKEPPYTISTFVSNDAVYTNSLNVNIRGSYLEFLYALAVYRLYVNISNFFLPASVCNSNSSLDIHGLEDQSLIRSERSKVYWTTNFPCMISTTDNVNVGWFKAATAIVPKVSGRALESILLKELTYVSSIGDVHIDYGLHRIFTTLETRNCYQIPFLSKQFILFLRIMLLQIHGLEKKLYIDRLLFRAVRDGLFDYHRNTVAHTKIKHTCALVGTRLANNVPKVLVRNKKVKLDYLGRNANLLTLCRHIDYHRVDAARLRLLVDVLDCLERSSSADKTKESIDRARSRLRSARLAAS